MSATERRPRVEVRRVEAAHAEELAEFYRAVWTPEATADSVLAARAKSAASNLAEPGVVPPTFAVFVEGKVGGYCSSLPVRVQVGGETQPAYWAKGLMVLPEYRNGPLGFSVLKALMASLPRCLVLTVAPGSKRLFAALGCSDLGPVPNRLRLLRPERILPRIDLDAVGLSGLPGGVPRLLRLAQRTGLARLGGYGVRGLTTAFAAMASTPAWGHAIALEDEMPPAAALDRLWEQVRPGFPAGVVRDGPYLYQRYGATVGQGGPYRWVVVRKRTEIVAAAVVRRPGEPDPRLGGVRLATLADLIASPRDRNAIVAALIGAERVARHWQADGILASQSHPAALAALRRRAWIPLPGNVHFFIRNAAPKPPEWPGQLADWWITRGDGESDAGF